MYCLVSVLCVVSLAGKVGDLAPILSSPSTCTLVLQYSKISVHVHVCTGAYTGAYATLPARAACIYPASCIRPAGAMHQSLTGLRMRHCVKPLLYPVLIDRLHTCVCCQMKHDKWNLSNSIELNQINKVDNKANWNSQ